MQGVTALYLSSTHKADAAEFVRRLLDNLQTRIQGNFKQVCFQLVWLDLNLCAYMTLFKNLHQHMRGAHFAEASA